MSLTDDEAILLINGKNFTVKRESLSQEDRRFLTDFEQDQQAEKKKVASRLFDFSSHTLGEWPRTIDSGLTEDQIVDLGLSDDDEFVYRTPHFEFRSPIQLSKSVVRQFARIYESTLLLMEHAPLGLNPRTDSDGFFVTQLYETKADYLAAGFNERTAGSMKWSVRNGKVTFTRVHIPLESLGVRNTARRLVVDSDADNSILVHELVHQLTAKWTILTEPWLSEGMADMMSSVTLKGGKFTTTNLERAVREVISGGGKEFQSVPLEKLMTMGSSEWDRFVSPNNASHYESANMLFTYFFLMDGDGNAAHLVDYHRALSEGVRHTEAQERHLLRGRSFAELEEAVAKQWNRNGLNVSF